MRIQYLNGGLANQMFQYIFSRFLELSNPGTERVILDNTFFYMTQIHNGYELERVFGLKPVLLKDCLDAKAWDVMLENKKLGWGVCQSLLRGGVDISMITESTSYTESMNNFDGKIELFFSNQYLPELADKTGNLYYYGYWINKHYLEKYRSIILNELKFPPITDSRNTEYQQLIREGNSVAVHIRRGDFISLGWTIDAEYYKGIIKDILDTYDGFTFVVFSDDIVWCKENEKNLGLDRVHQVAYVEGNTGGSNYIDMQLMSQCTGLISSNSSFAYMAALLNDNLGFCINPVSYREI